MRRDYRLIFIFLVAFLLRLATLGTQTVVTSDGAHYLRLAENIFSGEGYRNIYGEFSERPPFYSVLIGLLRFLIPDTEKCGKIVSMIFGMLIVYLIYKIGITVFGKNAALLASALAAIHPFLIMISTYVLRDSLHLFLLLGAVSFILLTIRSGKMIYPALTGLFLGLGYLTRIETILYLCSILIAMVFLKPAKRFGTLAVIILMFSIVILPYLIMVKNYTGSLSLGGEASRIEVIIHGAFQSSDNILLCVKNIFSEYVRNFNKAYLIILPTIFPPLLLFFFGIGMAADDYLFDKRKFVILTLCMFLPLFFHPFHFVEDRYYAIFIGLGLIFVSAGIIYFSSRWESIYPALKGKGISIFFIIILISFLPKMTQPFREDKYYRHWVEYKDMGLWMRENIGGKSRIIARKPFVAYYAGGISIFLPDLEPESLYAFAMENKAGYLIIDERSKRRYKYKNIDPFLTEEIFKGFRLINEIEKRPGYKIRLFDVR